MTNRETVERALAELQEDYAAPCASPTCGMPMCVLIQAYRALLAREQDATAPDGPPHYVVRVVAASDPKPEPPILPMTFDDGTRLEDITTSYKRPGGRVTDRETVERVADRMVALGATHLHLGTAEAGLLLRALLTRIEAAERERDEARETATIWRESAYGGFPRNPIDSAFPWEAHP